MLVYTLNKKVHYLSKRIKRTWENNLLSERVSDELLKDRINWCAPHLFAELLHNSTLQKQFATIKDLEVFHHNYPGKGKVDLPELINKLWIRNVMNRITIPGKMYSLIFDLKRFDEKGVSESDSSTYKEYCLFLEANREAILFISAFSKALNGYSNNYFVIEKKCADEILNSHRKAFPLCPTISDFIDSHFFSIFQDSYLFKLRNDGRTEYWEAFGNEISGLLWVKMAQKGTASELLDNWLDIVMLNVYHMYPSKCIDFMSEEIRRDFIQLILKRILDEPDLKEVNKELQKVFLEESHDRPMDVILFPSNVKFNETQGLEEKFNLIERVRSLPNKNLFFSQVCRYRINVLLSIILQSEKTEIAYRREDAKSCFPIIIDLLKAGNSRPHLLYELPTYILNFRPEIIPFLLIHKDLEVIGITLGNRVKISDASLSHYVEQQELEESYYRFKTELWRVCLDILLIHFALHRSSEKRQLSVLIISLLSQLASDTFKKPFYRGQNPKAIRDAKSERYLYTWTVLKTFNEGARGFGPYGTNSLSVVEKEFNELTDAVIACNVPPYHCDLYTPSLWLLDMHIQLLKLLRDPLVFNEKILLPDIAEQVKNCERALIDSLHKHYLSFFSMSKMKVHNHSLQVVEKDARFYLNTYGVDAIDWSCYLKSLSDTQLSEFIYAIKEEFDLSTCTEAQYIWGNGRVKEVSEKYYYHLKVLNVAFLQLIESPDNADEIILQIEKRITEIVCRYSETVLKDNKVDIFDKHSEMFTGERIFEQVIESVSFFTPKNRNKIIDSISKNLNQLDRIFVAFNLLKSEGDRDLLLKKINKNTIGAYLRQQNWLPDIQQILLHSVDSKELSDFAGQILRYIEPKLRLKGTKEFQVEHLYFEIKLLLAYRKKDKLAIEEMVAPQNPSPSHYNDFNYEDTAVKKFYLAALAQDDGNFDYAYKEFALLLFTHPHNILIASNTFGSAVELAKGVESKEERNLQLSKALMAWEDFEKSLPDKIKGKQNKTYVRLTKLEAFHLLKRYGEIDSLLLQLTKVERCSKPFAELIFNNRLEQHRYIEAGELVRELEDFHKFRSDEFPDFVIQLKKKLGVDDNIKALKSAYGNILNQTPENLIKALPPIVCERTDNLGDFFLEELILAAKGIQSKIIATGIKGEDKLTDILQLIFNARLSAWRMQWNSQERQGKTGKNNPARVDLSLNIQHHSFPIEAVRFNNAFNSCKKNLEKHILKNFNQTASRKFLFNVIYYQHISFAKDWKRFHEEFLPGVAFKPGFELQQPVILIDWNATTPNLKACKTFHENEVVCYYVFVDLKLFD